MSNVISDPRAPELDLDDLHAPSVINDPYPALRALREHEPLHWNDRWGGWVVTSHAFVSELLRSSSLSNDKYTPFVRMKTPTEDQEAVFRWLGLWLGSQDAPLHTRLRHSIQKAFTLRSAIDALEPVMHETTTVLLDRAEAAGKLELIHDFAYPLTSTVIASLLGMPYEDLHRVQSWADAVAPIMFMTPGGKDRYGRAREQLEDMADYFRVLLRRRAGQPRGDLISSLAEIMDEGGLCENEALATCMVVVFGGHETTKDLIGNGTFALTQHRDQFDLLRQDSTLMPTAIEELLRYESPAKSTARWATESISLGGKTIESGQRLLLFWAGANRDPERFISPDRLDLARADNPHLGFGWGAHYCIGAPLARREAGVVFQMMLERFPRLDLDVAPDELEWHPTLIMRGLRSLPLRLE